jgi:hypothetical protein
MFDFRDLDRIGEMADNSPHDREAVYVKIRANIKEITDRYVILSDPKQKNDEVISLVLLRSEIAALSSRRAEKLYIWGQLVAYSTGFFELVPDRDLNNRALVEIMK